MLRVRYAARGQRPGRVRIDRRERARRERVAHGSHAREVAQAVPTDWSRLVSYGLLHSPHPADHVREFLDAVSAALEAKHR